MEEWTVYRSSVQLGTRLFVASTNPNYPLSREDAKLIAAAPELLEALKAFMSACQDVPGKYLPVRAPCWRLAEAAVKKAEGR